MTLDVIHELVAFLAREATRKELHHAGIRVDFRESFAIGVFPTPKEQTFRCQHDARTIALSGLSAYLSTGTTGVTRPINGMLAAFIEVPTAMGL